MSNVRLIGLPCSDLYCSEVYCIFISHKGVIFVQLFIKCQCEIDRVALLGPFVTTSSHLVIKRLQTYSWQSHSQFTYLPCQKYYFRRVSISSTYPGLRRSVGQLVTDTFRFPLCRCLLTLAERPSTMGCQMFSEMTNSFQFLFPKCIFPICIFESVLLIVYFYKV